MTSTGYWKTIICRMANIINLPQYLNSEYSEIVRMPFIVKHAFTITDIAACCLRYFIDTVAKLYDSPTSNSKVVPAIRE